MRTETWLPPLILTIAALLTAGCSGAQTAPAAPEASESAEQATLSPEQVREDFDVLYAGLREAHYELDHHISMRELDAHFERLRREIRGPMSPFEAGVLFQRFVSRVGLGHTRVAFPAAEWSAFFQSGGRIFPLLIRVIDGRVWVREDLSGSDQVSAGDELLTIDGKPAMGWIERVSRHVSADSESMLHAILEHQFPVMMWIERGEVESFAIETRTAGGETRRIELAAKALHGDGSEDGNDDDEPEQFTPDGQSREHRIVDGIGYLKPGIFMNLAEGADTYDSREFEAFVDEAFASFLDAGVERLLIDMRHIPGGDNSFSDSMVAWFADRPFRFSPEYKIRVSPQTTASNAERLDGAGPGDASTLMAALFDGARNGDIVHLEIPLVEPRAGRRFEGPVYVLIDRHSYSNTATTAALIQDYGFGTLIGEATTDVATGFGGIERFTLPHSGKVVEYSKSFFCRPSGVARIHPVTPDIPIENPLLPGSQDVVLERAMEIVENAAIP